MTTGSVARIWRRMARAVGGTKIFAALLLLLIMLIVCSILYFYFEEDHNPDAQTLFSGFQWTFLALVDSPPWSASTGPGRTLHYVLGFLKPGLIAIITATVVSKLLEVVLRRGAGAGESKDKNHIVICGWSGKGSEIIEEIRGRGDRRPPSIVVLAPLKSDPTRDELTTFISGDPTAAHDLERAGIDKAATAIVLADNSYPDIDAEDMDSRSLLTTLAIEKLNPNCYTCVEVIDSKNRAHFERTGANEMVVSARLTGALLAHSAVTHGLTRVVGDLLTHPEGMEFYWLPAPQKVVGATFFEALSRLKQEHGCLPVALSNGEGDYVTNPPSDRVINDGDRLLVIAKENPLLA